MYSLNKAVNITYLPQGKARGSAQEMLSFLFFNPNGKDRAKNTTFSVAKFTAERLNKTARCLCVALDVMVITKQIKRDKLAFEQATQ